jgi:hypothetical protein
VKLYGFGIAAVIAAPFALKFVKMVDKGEIAHGGAHGSVAVGAVKVATGLHSPKLISVGQVIVGPVNGGTITLKLHVLDPFDPVAWNVTTFVPEGKEEPLGKPAI